ncbi:hypothetical protein DRE_01558 [Drechslerella stenobrocha 248]|uniref:Uncharacterized protein n=1 Tax=Drechslerella stenobrocha 248 TaxID=1043628 RepID=W7HIG4_9PEZI|nr:hypothetical protein DRE_01558 [Drechslerella stenobrocha 248]
MSSSGPGPSVPPPEPNSSPTADNEALPTRTDTKPDSNETELEDDPRSTTSTPSPSTVSSYIARQIFHADAITVHTVFVDNLEEDFLDELVFRIFSTTVLSHLLNEIERYRGLERGTCAFFHHGRRLRRSFNGPAGVIGRLRARRRVCGWREAFFESEGLPEGQVLVKSTLAVIIR